MSASNFSHERLDQLFAAIDSNSGGAFGAFLTEDARFRFGSAPAISGRTAIEAGVNAFFESIGGCRHEIIKVLTEEHTMACEGKVTYTRLDNSTVTLPFVDMLEFDGQLIRDYRIYIDISPLYET